MDEHDYRQVVLITLMQCLKALEESGVPAIRLVAGDRLESLCKQAETSGYKVR